MFSDVKLYVIGENKELDKKSVKNYDTYLVVRK